ncbi:MAG: HAD family hydrolase [Candidatus Woesearchaeota archaeon]
MISTYLFDLDDTLINASIYEKIYPNIIRKIRLQFKLTEEMLDEEAEKLNLKKNQFGRWDTRELCKGLGMLDMYYQELERAIEADSFISEKALYAISNLKMRGRTIGIVSNSMHRTIQTYLKRYGLARYVDFIFSSEDAGCNKNEDKFWSQLIQKFSLKTGECLMCGDNVEEDVNKPRKFGFKTFHVLRPADLARIPDLFS